MNDKATDLFSTPSFMQGVGSLFDILGTLNQYNTSASAEDADEEALHSDWQVVGEDIQQAMKTIMQETDR